MAEIINPDIGGTEVEIPGGINPDTGTITGPSIQSEINSINEAKENLAQSLINKFGVQGQDILDGNGNVVTSGLANSDGSLKRIASWSLVVNNTSLYWADQPVSNTANTETTPQFARIGLGVEPESNYSISTNDPIKILDNGKLLELARNSGTSDIYIQYNLGASQAYKFGINNEGSFIWGKAIAEDGNGNYTFTPLMSLDKDGNLNITNSIVNNNVTAKLSKSTTPIISSSNSETLIPTYKAVWDLVSTKSDEVAHEAFHLWGGKSLTGQQSPIDALLGTMASANRFASFMSPNQQFGSAYLNSDAGTIMFEYSNDGGQTWHESTGRTALLNRTLFGGQDMFTSGYNISPGRPDQGSNSGYSEWNGQTAADFIKRGMRITIDLGKSNSNFSGWSQYAFELNKIILFRRNKSGNGTISVDKYAWNKNTSTHSTTKTTLINNFQLNDSISNDTWVVLNLGGNHSFGGSPYSSNARKIVITAFGALTFNKILGFGPSSNAALGGTYLGDYGVPYFIDGNLKMTLEGALQVNKPIIANDLIYAYSGITSNRVIPIYKGISVNGDISTQGSITASVDISAQGNITASGDITASGNISASGGVYATLIQAEDEIYAANNIVTDSSISASGNISAGSNITAAAFYENSDKSLKQNIIDILDTDLYKVSNIKFKEFEFKNESTKKYGVIAQDLQEVGLNNLIKEVQTENKSYLTVDYISLLCLKVSQLEQEIKKLKELISK